MRIGIIGGGIIGLAVARELAARAEVTVLEKEDRLAGHQTGRNSGVVHAGIYYPPGSLKARLCRRGVGLLRDYCRARGIPYDEVGKLVIAASRDELPRLQDIADRARANGVPGIEGLGPDGLREIEPKAAGVAAVHSPYTAITDFAAVARGFAGDVAAAGGRVLTGHPVRAVRGASVIAGGRRFDFDRVVACAGLCTDAVARLARAPGDVRIVPFRGEFHLLRRASLVRGLIYPVPDPRYPFLGVHLTRRVDGSVLVGPNAVLALALEGYGRRDVRLGELAAALSWPGTVRLARRHWRTGLREMWGSLSKRAFAAAARRYVPEIGVDDLAPAPSGVRAQAVDREGNLVDDFVLDDTAGPLVIVRNAPSPAATSSLAIAEHIAGRITGRIAGRQP